MRSRRVICSPWVKRRRGPRSMSWGIEILIAFPSIRRQVTCIGVRLGRTRTTIVLRPAARVAMTRSTRRGRPETLAGRYSWPTITPIANLTMRRGRAGRLSIRRNRSMIPRNNTGLRELPPAQPAFIWYPYGPSHDFPEVGTGGRNAMAGPVYYTDLYPVETDCPTIITAS